MLKRPAHHRFYDRLFKGDFHVFTGDFAAVLAFCDRLKLKTDAISSPKLAKTLFCTKDSGEDLCILWFSPRLMGWSNPWPVLAHEAHHASTMLLSARGVTESAICDELGAYYQEWLMTELRRALRRRRTG
jgi:hypothetical protein